MTRECDLIGDLAVLDGRQKQGQRLGPNEAGSNEHMRRGHLDIVGNEMQQRPRVDRITSHPRTLRQRSWKWVRSRSSPLHACNARLGSTARPAPDRRLAEPRQGLGLR